MHVRALAVVAAVAALSTTSIAANAQVASTQAAGPSAWRLIAGVGYGGIYDDEGSIGRGPELSVGAGRRLNGTWSLEGVVFRQAHQRRDVFRVDGDATGAVGRVAVHVGNEAAPARAFVSGGLGIVRHSGTLGFVADPREPQAPVSRSTYEATGMVTEAGVGMDIPAGRRWFLRPELRVRWTTVSRPAGGPEPPYLSGTAGVTAGWRP